MHQMSGVHVSAPYNEVWLDSRRKFRLIPTQFEKNPALICRRIHGSKILVKCIAKLKMRTQLSYSKLKIALFNTSGPCMFIQMCNDYVYTCFILHRSVEKTSVA